MSSPVVRVLVLTDQRGERSCSVHLRPEGLVARLEREWFERAGPVYALPPEKIAADRDFLARADWVAKVTWLRGQFQERGEQVYIAVAPFDQS